MPDSERPWNQDPKWNPNLPQDEGAVLRYTGGGRLRPRGNLFEVSLSIPLVGLELNQEGGRLYPTSRTSAAMPSLVSFGSFSDIRFGWREVEKVERIRRWVPWDRGVRFILSDGERFIFYSLNGGTLNKILDFAEARDVKVEKKPGSYSDHGASPKLHCAANSPDNPEEFVRELRRRAHERTGRWIWVQ